MQIGVYIDNTWVPAFLNVNSQGIILKTENKTIIINFKEITRLHKNDQNFIEIMYVTLKNGEAVKQALVINADNIDEVMKLLSLRDDTKESDKYVPPEVNVFTQKNIPVQEISQENIIKQQNMNEKSVSPKKGIPVIIVAPIIIFLFIFGTYFLRIQNLNTKETLMGLFWSNQNITPNYFTYEFLEDGNCRYSHFEETGKVIKNCKYEIKGKKIKIQFDNEEILNYNWKIKYEISEFKIKTVLYLDQEKFTSR